MDPLEARVGVHNARHAWTHQHLHVFGQLGVSCVLVDEVGKENHTVACERGDRGLPSAPARLYFQHFDGTGVETCSTTFLLLIVDARHVDGSLLS